MYIYVCCMFAGHLGIGEETFPFLILFTTLMLFICVLLSWSLSSLLSLCSRVVIMQSVLLDNEVKGISCCAHESTLCKLPVFKLGCTSLSLHATKLRCFFLFVFSSA